MSDPHGIVPSDLQLAKMAGKKLAYLLNGLFSGGLGGLAVGCSLDAYLPRDFKRICAFIEVLRATETTFQSQSEKVLARLIQELEERFFRFHDCFVVLNQQRQKELEIIETYVNKLLSAYFDLLEVEQKYLEFIGTKENDLSRHKAEAQPTVAAFLHEISKVNARKML